MCMKGTDEGCVLRDELMAVKQTTTNLDSRLTQVEHDVKNMRSETHEGIKALDSSVANLAHDFGQRFNNIEATVVSEKVKWGETLRWVVKVAVRVILAGAAMAMGVTGYKALFKGAL